MKTERHFIDWVPEKPNRCENGYLKPEKGTQILLDSDYVSMSQQMQSLLHSNVTCHSNAEHSLRKGKHFIWLLYGHVPHFNDFLKWNLNVGKLQKNTETLFNLKDTMNCYSLLPGRDRSPFIS